MPKPVKSKTNISSFISSTTFAHVLKMVLALTASHHKPWRRGKRGRFIWRMFNLRMPCRVRSVRGSIQPQGPSVFLYVRWVYHFRVKIAPSFFFCWCSWGFFFSVAMLTFPEVMKKAQEEIDRVIGQDRMPEFHDKDQLPYVVAVINETLRYVSSPPSPFGKNVSLNSVYG